MLSFDIDTVILKAGTVSASLKISLTKASNSAINAEIFVLDNTAKLGKDFRVSQRIIKFLPGQKSKSITITTLKKALTAHRKNATLLIKYNANVVVGCRQYAKLIFQPTNNRKK